MFDLAAIRTAEGKFVCNILPHKKFKSIQQHYMTEAPTTKHPKGRGGRAVNRVVKLFLVSH
jgi:hypothetical protein